MKKKNQSYYSNAEISYSIKSSTDLSNLSFAASVTAIIAVVLMITALDFATFTFKTTNLLIGTVFLAEALIAYFVRFAAKSNIVRRGEISRGIRMLGILLILLICTGNVFTCAAGMQLVKKEKNLEYQIGVYAVLVEVLIMVMSCLNILKGYVVSTFFAALIFFAVIVVFRIIVLYFVSKYVNRNMADKRLIPLVILLVVSCVDGNVLALIMALIILRKMRNKDPEISVNWIDIFKRLFRSQAAVIGLFFFVFLITLSLTAKYTFDYDLAVNNDYSAILQSPSLYYPLGTDDYGRCVFTRIIFGAKISLLAGLAAVTFSAVIGTAMGAAAGYFGGLTDNILMRILDVFMAVPGLLLPIAIVTSIGTSLPSIVIALAIGTVPSYARTVRAPVMTMKGREFVEAAKMSGAKNGQIIMKHILPNCLAPLIVRATMGFGGSVLGMSSLSYLGVGLEAHIPEWGNIIKAGSTYLEQAPWLAVFPGIVIILLVLSVNFMGDGLRDAMDPKLK